MRTDVGLDMASPGNSLDITLYYWNSVATNLEQNQQSLGETF